MSENLYFVAMNKYQNTFLKLRGCKINRSRLSPQFRGYKIGKKTNFSSRFLCGHEIQKVFYYLFCGHEI